MSKQKLTAIVVFDIDGVIRDVSSSYRRAIADTVEHFTAQAWRPTMEDIDRLKAEGTWNNDWQASQELVYRYFESVGKPREETNCDYNNIVAFFQDRYRGVNWDGYIATESLLLSVEYLEQLSTNQIGWGFFSGATRGSAEYILQQRLGLTQPVLVAMEDAPGKPDPKGLFMAISQIQTQALSPTPVLYVGDTVADMYTVIRAREAMPERAWFAIGILPPHVQTSSQRQQNYQQKLIAAGADIVLHNVEQLTSDRIQQLFLGGK